MADDTLSATRTIDAPVETIFAVLADPATHAAIDGTGWVREPVDVAPLTATGQIFRMAMFHAQHPDGDYQIANRVKVLERPGAISWEPGYDAGDGTLGFGGWIWGYNLTPAGSEGTEVTLTYDWSAVPDEVRDNMTFPPFGPDHLNNSLAHLADLASARTG